jgi:hypothetical protein
MYLKGILCGYSRSRVQLSKLWWDEDKFVHDWYGVKKILPYFGWYQEMVYSYFLTCKIYLFNKGGAKN